MDFLATQGASRNACSTQPYVCVDTEGQSHTRLNVLHADAVPRHRPSDDQLAEIEYYYCSQSASIITLSNFTLAILKVLLSILPTYLGQDMYGVLIHVLC
jgi:hypothetical protein